MTSKLESLIAGAAFGLVTWQFDSAAVALGFIVASSVAWTVAKCAIERRAKP